MAIGYILIGAKNSFEHKVANKISMLDEVIDVEPLIVEEIALAEPFFENYDLIVKVKLNFAKDFNNFINQKLRY